MWICPVCNRKNEEKLLCCPVCSFDASSNYENFDTLNSLAEGTAAISRRKESAIESTIKSGNGIDWQNVTAVAQCLWHTVVLYRDGRTAAFWDNDMDQCEVSDWEDITAIACGHWHTVGLKSDGTVVSAGDNIHGQCGISNLDHPELFDEDDDDFYWDDDEEFEAKDSNEEDSEEDEDDFDEKFIFPEEWNDITTIACGMWHTVGLKADGTVVAVGDSTKGACNVNGWSRIRRIACGNRTTLGLDMDGNILTAGKPKCDGQFVLTEREKDFLPYTDIRKI